MKIDLIILNGYMKIVVSVLLQEKAKSINIPPKFLPEFPKAQGDMMQKIESGDDSISVDAGVDTVVRLSV